MHNECNAPEKPGESVVTGSQAWTQDLRPEAGRPPSQGSAQRAWENRSRAAQLAEARGSRPKD